MCKAEVYGRNSNAKAKERNTAHANGAFYYNPVTSVTIGAGVTLGDAAFPSYFVSTYNTGNKAAAPLIDIIKLKR